MSAPETLRDALLDDLEEGLRATEVWGVALSDRLDAIIAAARAESDALRAALRERIVENLLDVPLHEHRIRENGERVLWLGMTYAEAVSAVDAALAPSPAEPAEPEREP